MAQLKVPGWISHDDNFGPNLSDSDEDLTILARDVGNGTANSTKIEFGC